MLSWDSALVVLCGLQVAIRATAQVNTTNIPTTTTTTGILTTVVPTTTLPCTENGCHDNTCDFWDTHPITNFDCLELEEDHGCDCSHCRCVNTEFPADSTTPLVVNTTTTIETTLPPIETTMPPIVENVCSDGTVAVVCLMDLEIDQLVALFALPAFWILVFVLAGSSKSMARCYQEAKQRQLRKKQRGNKKRKSRKRRILNYSFSKVAKLSFLTHSRSWEQFRERAYAEMEKIDFQGVPLAGFRSSMMYGMDLYSQWSGTALISAWKSAMQASCFAGIMLWVLYFLAQLQNWGLLDATNTTIVTESISTTTPSAAIVETTMAVLNNATSLFTEAVTLTNATAPPNVTTIHANTTTTTTTTTSTYWIEDDLETTTTNTTGYTTLEMVRANIAAVAEMNAAIEEYVSFMLIFYTILNVNNYLRCFKCAMQLQQAMENMALNFAAIYPSFHKTKRSKYQLYRYLNTLHFFAYAFLIPEYHKESKQFPLYLSNVGLLTKREVCTRRVCVPTVYDLND